jgi:hypothetical protein
VCISSFLNANKFGEFLYCIATDVSSLCVAFKPTDSGLQNTPYCSYQESDLWNNSQSDKDNTGFKCGERREWREHRIDRVLGFFSSRPNGDPLTRRQVCVPPFGSGREGGATHLLAGEGEGGLNSDEVTDTVLL